MNAGLPLEYGYARLSARLSARPDDRLWRQLRSARSLQAAIDAVRGSSAAPYVAGVGMGGTIDDVELGFRQHLRTRIREAVGWAPQAWQSALRWTEALIDLPALQHLLAEAPLPKWLRADPQLASYVAPNRSMRRALLAQGWLAPLIAAAETAAPPRRTASARREALHPLLQAWQAQWQQRWPDCSEEEHAALQRLLRTVRSHLLAFAALSVETAAQARAALAERTLRQLHAAAAQPVALFAYLLLVAVDVERLRGEFVLRAAGALPADEVSP
jgi:hypothetical protein